MKLRKPVNEMCRQCTHDPLDAGSVAQQIACCTISNCRLHPVRPVTAKVIPLRLLDHWGISIDSLCERARPLVENASSCSVEGQSERLAGRTATTHTNGAGRDIQLP
jgi:hypothetical protein